MFRYCLVVGLAFVLGGCGEPRAPVNAPPEEAKSDKQPNRAPGAGEFRAGAAKVEITDKGDHYDPAARAVRLLPQHHDGRSVAAVAIAAHEVSHAIQHAREEPAFLRRMELVTRLVWVERLATVGFDPIGTTPEAFAEHAVAAEFREAGDGEVAEAAEAGEGAMGAVYRARDTVLNRTVAIKVMNATIARDQGLRDRFLREARISLELDHPSVLHALELGRDNAGYYLICEWIDGGSLATSLPS